MKKILLAGALLLVLFSTFGCGELVPLEDSAPTEKETAVQEYPTVADPLTWEKIRSIPIATDDMTEAEKRKICTDFMRLQLTFQWTPEENLEYVLSGQQKEMHFDRGRVYGGLPYRSFDANGNLYTFMEFYDSETGVLSRGNYPQQDFAGIIGNDCASSPFWAWNRVVNSGRNFKDFELEIGVTNIGLTPENHFPAVGGYTTISQGTWDDGDGTREICRINGEEKMFEAYSALQPADGLVHFYPSTGSLPNANHLMMCSSVATVVRKADGSIDGEKSFVTILDQRSNLTTVHGESGTVHYEGGVDAVFTFAQLLKEYYIPFTFLEFSGADPVEPATASLAIEGSSPSFEALRQATVTANYAISHLRLTFTDENGKEVYDYLVRPKVLNTRSCTLEKLILPTTAHFANGKNTCRITVLLGSGQEFTLFEGIPLS